MDYVTISGVELVTVGMKWPASTGPVTLTLEHLADMLAASEDPLIQAPRVKIGHVDPRFDDELPDHDPFYDGEPVYGTVTNLRLENDGAVLMGDLVEVPAWLAEAAPSAFPSRSAEWVWDVETEASNNYTAVLTAVSFLGEAPPAIKDLEDLERVLASGPEELAAATEGEPVGAVTARADIDKVIDTFYADYAVEEDGRYWWWVRAVWTDPNELIVDDDEGGLVRIPFTSDDGQEISFDEPVPVKQTFVDAATGKRVPAFAAKARPGTPAQVFAEREKSAPPDRQKGGAAPSSTVEHMDPKLLRKALGLSPEATDEEVEQRVAAQAAEAESTPDPSPDPTPDPDPSPDPEPTPDPNPSPDPDPEPEPAEGGQPPQPAPGSEEPQAGTTTIDTTVLAELQRNAAEGAAARAEQVTERRESILEDAVKAGKITVASKDDWRKKLVSAPEATEKELEGLATGLVPVDPKGSSAPANVGDQLRNNLVGAFNLKLPDEN